MGRYWQTSSFVVAAALTIACGRIGFDGSSATDGGSPSIDATNNRPDATAVDASVPFDAVRGQAHQVFLTSSEHLGSLGGVSGADSECQSRAQAANLSGTYLAWISSTESDAPDVRFTRSDGPYRLVDGTVIANDWDDLTDQSIIAPLDKDEFGEPTDATRFWTNVTWKGSYAGPLTHCTAWLGIALSGNVGDTTATNPGWTNVGNISCLNVFPIACFKQ